MTTVDSPAARSGYHLVKSGDAWLLGQPLLGALGVRKLSDEKAAPFQDRIDRIELSPQARAAQPDGAPRILTMSVDVHALTEKTTKTQALFEKQEALRLNDPTADADAFFAQFRAKMDRVGEAGKRLTAAMMDVTPYAVIRDKQGKVVGRLFQDGGFETSDPRFHGLQWAVSNGRESIVDGKHNRYEAIKKALGGMGHIELTGVDVDTKTLLPNLRKDMQAAQDALKALRDNWQNRLDAYHATQATIRDLWA